MSDDHWFDTLHKSLVRENPRRTLLGAAGAVASLARGLASDVTMAKPRKHKDKRKNTRKDKKDKKKDKGSTQPLDLSCDGQIVQDTCRSHFEGDEAVEKCEATCRRCQQEESEFCVHWPGNGYASEYPFCCHPDESCCAQGVWGECCPPEQCCNKGNRYECCKAGETCCPGVDCYTCRAPKVLNIDTCQCECSPDIDCPAPYVLDLNTCVCEIDGCPHPSIPNPCPGLPGDCVQDNNRVCCLGFSCQIGSGNNPDHYSCCGREPENHLATKCVRFDEPCPADRRYPPLATHCRLDDPVCLQPPGGG